MIPLLAAFNETPWIGQLFGALIGAALLIAIFTWIIFGVVDLYRRHDIGRGKKLLWLTAFILLPPVLVIYGAVRFSSTGGEPG